MKQRWIAHNQNEMPRRLHPDTLVKLMIDSKKPSYPSCLAIAAWCVAWESENIIGYQIVEED